MSENQYNSHSLPFRNFFINSYILPGFLLVVATLLICFVFRSALPEWAYVNSDSFIEALNNGSLVSLIAAEIPFYAQVLVLVVAVFVSIIAGNAVAVIASLMFDLIWQGKGIGWPYERILSHHPPSYISRCIVICLITLLHALCLVEIFVEFKYFSFCCWAILILFIAKDLVRVIYNKILGADEDIKKFLEEETEGEEGKIFEKMGVLFCFAYKDKENRGKNLLIYFLSQAYLLDVSVFLAIFLGKFFGISHGVDNYTKEKFLEKMEALQPDYVYMGRGTNNYWRTYIALANGDDVNMRIANNHLRRSNALSG